MNIKELRAALDELEANWTKEQEEVYGKIEDQPIYIDTFNITPDWKTCYIGLGECPKPVYSFSDVAIVFSAWEQDKEKKDDSSSS